VVVGALCGRYFLIDATLALSFSVRRTGVIFVGMGHPLYIH
jgi:hypothetical protein